MPNSTMPTLKNKKKAQIALYTIISFLRFLTRSGNAVRGHLNHEGNLWMLLEKRAHDNSYLKLWMNRRNNYLSPQIQNELLEIMAHMVFRDSINEIKKSFWFSIIADGTTDISEMEQFSLIARINDHQTLERNELFLGLYNAPDSKGRTLASVIKDILIRLNLSIDNLLEHCFDGAPNMSGCNKGVQRI